MRKPVLDPLVPTRKPYEEWAAREAEPTGNFRGGLGGDMNTKYLDGPLGVCHIGLVGSQWRSLCPIITIKVPSLFVFSWLDFMAGRDCSILFAAGLMVTGKRSVPSERRTRTRLKSPNAWVLSHDLTATCLAASTHMMVNRGCL